MTVPDLNPQPTASAPAAPNRRLLLGGTAAGAALLGVGVALWRSPSTVVLPVAEPVEGFWSMQWDTPQSDKLSMQSLRGRPLLLNFWATWCAPCVEELPLLNDFHRQNKGNGWQVLGLAVDKLAPVQSFLRKMPLDFPVGMAGLAGAELGRGLGNVAGGLPFSVVFGANGAVLYRKLGRLHPADLAEVLSLK
jgi:thiol-disulfide isomerase/thioredoxin